MTYVIGMGLGKFVQVENISRKGKGIYLLISLLFNCARDVSL